MTQRAISLPFSFNSAGEVSYSEDEKKIIQDRVVLAVMTRPGERVMRPSYGSAIYNTLFEDTDEAVSIAEQAVGLCFSENFPYLNLVGVVGSLDTDSGTLELDIQYKKGQQSLTESLTVKTTIFSRSGEVIQEVS